MKIIYLLLAALMFAVPQMALSQAVKTSRPLEAGTEDCEVPEACSADQEDTLASEVSPALRALCADKFAAGGVTSYDKNCAIQATPVPATGSGKTER